MAPLAQAYVRIRPQLSEAEVRASATRAGEQAGAAMGRSMSTGLSRSVKAFAGLGAATGLVEAGRKVLEFADQFEGARARVETNTENIGASFVAVQKPLGDLDSKMSGLGFTITDTENSFAQLVTATKSPAKSLRDVALAADIARGRHVSLDTATQILMRVETGHVAMLGRLGIATRDASGHIFTQEQALEALGRAYGGNAAKFAETFAGKQAAARAEIQQSATEIGVALLPALSDLANVVAHDVLPPIASAAQWFDRNKKTVEPLVGTVLKLALAWKVFTLATKGAEAVTRLFGRTAATTATELVAEGAAGRVAASGVAAEGAAAEGAALGRGGRLSRVGLGVGLGAAVAGSFVPGTGGKALSDAGTGAAIGSVIGPEGAAAGAAIGGLHALLSSSKEVNPRYRLGTIYHPLAPQMKTDTAAANTLKTATDALTGSERTLGASFQRTANQMSGHVAHALALRSAQDGLREAMHAAAQTAADSGRALIGNSDAALANRDALRAQVTQIFAVIDAMKARGATDQAQSQMISILTQAVEQNAISLYGDKSAVDSFLRSVGLIPGQVAGAVNAIAALNNAVASDKAISPSMVRAATSPAATTAAKVAGNKIAASFTSGYTPVVSKAAASTAKAVSTSMNQAAERVQNDLQTIRDSISSTQSSIAGFAAFQTSGTDTLGASGANTDFIAQKRDKAAQLEQFAKLYGRLVAAGLNPDDLHEFVGLGPAAIPAMQALLSAGRSGIRQENALDRRINNASLAVARQDAASQNLGLIHRDLQTLPNKLERVFVKGIKQLHILTDVNAIDRANGRKILAH